MPEGRSPVSGSISLGHLTGLVKRQDLLHSQDGHPIEVWDFTPPTDENILSAWAIRFRQTYCDDTMLSDLRDGTPYTSNREFLLETIFPDESEDLGPATRSGDFGELLISDYLEFFFKYWVVKDKYGDKQIRNESIKGIDVVGLRFEDPRYESPKDSLITYEVKSRLTGKSDGSQMQLAATDSAKDYLKVGETLQSMKRRFLHKGDKSSAGKVQRFQNPTDKPFQHLSGAAAILSSSVYHENTIVNTVTATHWNKTNLILMVISGPDLMRLVHHLYQRAADEA